MKTSPVGPRRLLQGFFILCLVILLPAVIFSQETPDPVLNKIAPQKLAAAIKKKASRLEEKIAAKTNKTLQRLKRQEEKVYKKLLSGKDSLQARARLRELDEKYNEMRTKLAGPDVSGRRPLYVPKLDSLSTALKFLGQNGTSEKLNDAMAATESLRDKFTQAEEVKKFIRERKLQLRQQLEQLGLVKELKKFQKEVYYYEAQLKEYKEILKDSKKAERKALELLSKTRLFRDFMRKNSALASLFGPPGGNEDPSAMLAGLQTRSQVNNLIQQQLAAGGPNAQQQFQQNLQQAQSQLNALKDKVLKAGGSSGDDIMPEGFKPNDQKTKSFWKRLEYGTNVQTKKATSLFPVTSDIGLSLGYKLNDKSVIGIGTSFKMGWGTGWRHIRISSQGVGLRAYLDQKLKGSFWISGGYEMNYNSAFNNIGVLQHYSAWQRSGLLGVSKVISLKTKFFKKTKLQLLWDFLSYEQVPRTQPVVFRVGYNF